MSHGCFSDFSWMKVQPPSPRHIPLPDQETLFCTPPFQHHFSSTDSKSNPSIPNTAQRHSGPHHASIPPMHTHYSPHQLDASTAISRFQPQQRNTKLQQPISRCQWGKMPAKSKHSPPAPALQQEGPTPVQPMSCTWAKGTGEAIATPAPFPALPALFPALPARPALSSALAKKAHGGGWKMPRRHSVLTSGLSRAQRRAHRCAAPSIHGVTQSPWGWGAGCSQGDPTFCSSPRLHPPSTHSNYTRILLDK